MRTITFILLAIFSLQTYGQSYRNNSLLKLEDIMKGEEWLGSLPDDQRWSQNGKYIYFTWNPDNKLIEPLYRYEPEIGETRRMQAEDKKDMLPEYGLEFNRDRDLILFTRNGSLWIYDLDADSSRILLNLGNRISAPLFSVDEESIYFTMENNLYRYSMSYGTVEALTNMKEGEEKKDKEAWNNEQEEWLYKDQQELFDILKQNKEKKKLREEEQKALKADAPLEIYYGKAGISGFSISGDEKYVFFLKFHRDGNGKRTEMPRYVTESGFTDTESVRNKVGYPYGHMELGIYNTQSDTVYYAAVSELPGIMEHTVFEEEQYTETREEARKVYLSAPVWNEDRTSCVVNIRSTDNKDRWIAILDPETGKFNVIDRQRDEAWIAGPGIGWSFSGGTLGWIDDSRIYFQSEESGYSHLYVYDLEKQKKKALTKGDFEVYDPQLSVDKESFYFHSNEEHYGERHFYRMSVDGGRRTRLTFMKGRNDVSLSPDEKHMLIRHSTAIDPWELYLAETGSLDKNTAPEQFTESTTTEFESYNWRIPEYIRFRASDGEMVPARLYRPEESVKNGAAVVFVHGAGYLQNAHKWWSNYYREYMFHNFLVDNGYTVLDIDYRASAGYGRDWRTAIYRHMGGKDLDDHVDGAAFLVDNEDIDPDRIGIYGGSYGGFITLMAMFTSPGTFAAGAALRPVTDWAHYNHGYTSNILNTPVKDSLSYRRSSPIYFADGLEGHLVMCHGMLDDNVHFQDVVRLSQRLIELQKDNWELAAYPIEPHGFKEWTSWLDEYKRVYEIFEESLFGREGE